MAYSDYGGFAWKVQKNGLWEPYPEAEDGTLSGIQAPKGRPLEAKAGLKLDVLLNAYEKQGLDYAKDSESSSDDDWLIKHPHHCVLGGMKGLALVGHKSSATIVADGKQVKPFPVWPEWDNEKNTYVNDGKNPYEDGAEEKVDLGNWKYAMKASHLQSDYILMALRIPDGTSLVGVSGYGIGDHGWQDEEGYEFLRAGERIDLFPKGWLDKKRKKGEKIPKKTIEPFGVTAAQMTKLMEKYEVLWHWDSTAFDKDKKRFKLKTGHENIGRKPVNPWPKMPAWKLLLESWVKPILDSWKGEA